jgi:chromosome segregation ATPase
MGSGKTNRLRRKNDKYLIPQSPLSHPGIGISVLRINELSSSPTAANAQEARPTANGSKPEAAREFTVSQPSLETAKSRIEEVLGRMKSTVEQINPTAAPRGTETGAEAETEERPRADDSVYADLENRKSQIILAVRAAEEKAREAELAFKQLELRLEEEVAKRRVAEERLFEVEEGLAQQVSALEVLGIKRLEAESALEQHRSRLTAEHEVRSKLENEIFEARSQADAFSLKLVKLENLKTEAEAKAAAAENIVREVEAMVYQSESLANEAFEKFKALEADLAREVELRLFAEKQLSDLAEGVNLDGLPFELANPEVKVAAEPVVQIVSLADDQRRELEKEIETQREARLSAEKKLGAVESETQTLKEQLAAETRTLKEQLAAETRSLKDQLTKANEKQSQLDAKQRELIKARDAEQTAVKTRKSEFEQLQARLRTAETTLKSKEQMLVELTAERDRLKSAPPVPATPVEANQQQRKMRILGLSAGIIVLIVIIVILAVAALQQF